MISSKKKFIEFALKKEVLKFGHFTLKSNRNSPYFFDASMFNTGYDLYLLGNFYAELLIKNFIEFNVLFGSAYKGIPIVISTVIALSNYYKKNILYSFNRKEIKNHGEKGLLVGSKLFGKVIIIDDVITSGISIEQSIDIIYTNQAKLAGILVAFDRQENSSCLAKEISKTYQVPIFSIITFNDLILFLQEKPEMFNFLKKMINYQKTYQQN